MKFILYCLLFCLLQLMNRSIYAGNDEDQFWCYKDEEDQPCAGAAGKCILNPDGSQGGFVAQTAQLRENWHLSKEARICEQAQVYGNAFIFHDASIYGNAKIYGSAWVYSNAQVYGDAWIYGNARVYDNAQVYGNAHVYGDAQIYGNAQIYDTAQIYQNAQIYENARIYGNAKVSYSYKVSKDRAIFQENYDQNAPLYANLASEAQFKTLDELKIHCDGRPYCGICREELYHGDLITRTHCNCSMSYCINCLSQAFLINPCFPTCREGLLPQSSERYKLNLN